MNAGSPGLRELIIAQWRAGPKGGGALVSALYTLRIDTVDERCAIENALANAGLFARTTTPSVPWSSRWTGSRSVSRPTACKQRLAVRFFFQNEIVIIFGYFNPVNALFDNKNKLFSG